MAGRRYIPGQPPNSSDPFMQQNWLQNLRRGVVSETKVKYPILLAEFTANIERLYACDATTASFAALLPSAALNADKCYVFKKIDSTANTITVTRLGTDTIDGAATVILTTQWDWLVIRSDGISQWYIETQRLGGSTGTFNPGVVITTTGAFSQTVPAAVNLARVWATAGGGGGAASTTANGGGGGGSAEFTDIVIPVTAGGTLTGTVGAAGVGGTAAADDATDGGTTTVGIVSVLPGLRGRLGASAGGAGGGRLGGAGGTEASPGNPGVIGLAESIESCGGSGGGGAGTGNDTQAGGAGGPSESNTALAGGVSGTLQAGGGSGGSSPWGQGGQGGVGGGTAVTSAGAAPNAVAYGAGGGGAGERDAGAVAGGNGRPGVVMIQWL